MKKVIVMFAILNMFHTGLSCVDDLVNPFNYDLNYIELSYMRGKNELENR